MRMLTFKSARHFAEADLEPSAPACPFCDSAERHAVGRLQDDPPILLLRCADCHAVSASRVPTPVVLRQCYAGYAQVYARYGTEHQVTHGAVARLARHIARGAGPMPGGSRLRLLDFGGGDGSIAIALARRYVAAGAEQVDICVVDLLGRSAPTGDARIRCVACATLAEAPPGETYDLVVASAIVEHLPQPRPDLLRLLAAVKPGGVFYARTPYVVPLARAARGVGLRLDLDYPAHLHDLGPAFWRCIFARLGPAGAFERLAEGPSPVERSFRHDPLPALAACVAKAPWYVLGDAYALIGGWEVLARKRATS